MEAHIPWSSPRILAPRIRVNPWLALFILTLGFLIIILDSPIVNLAIPSMELGQNAPFDEIL